MKLSDLDPVIYRWSARFGLTIFTEFRDSEVRCIHIVDDSGDIYDIGLSLAADSNQVLLHISGGKRCYQKDSVDFAILEESLNTAYGKILEWIAHRGHTRTPILRSLA